jgi:putative ABC transport system permease protein
LLVAQLAWPHSNFRTTEDAIDTYQALVAEVQRAPGVVGAAPLLIGPFSGTGGWDGAFVVEGRSETDPSPILNMEVGSPTFFSTMGIPLRSGRIFADLDRRGTPLVVILSESAARAMWPGDDAIGKRVRGAGNEWWTVIGVVADTRYREFRTPRATVYFPLLQLPFPYPPTNLVVRTSGDPALMTATLRRAIATVDPDLVLSRATTMTSLLEEPLAQPRFNAMLLTVFAVVVLVLAVVGLYGVLAWTVRQRTRELGIRIALGAQPRQVHFLVMRHGILIAAAGTIVGLLGAVAASRVLRSLLYEISPTDLPTMLGACAMLLIVALVACLLPARRATRVDPVLTLRAE